MYYLKISIIILLIALCNSDSFPQTNSNESVNKSGYDIVISDKLGIYPGLEFVAQFDRIIPNIVFGLGLEIFH